MKPDFKFPEHLSPEVKEKFARYRKQGIKTPPLKNLRTPEQLEDIRASARINTGILDYITPYIQEGISTGEIDRLVHKYTTSRGAVPAPLNYEGFPNSCCVSINEVVCHGIPSSTEILKNGDILNVDVSTIYNGYFQMLPVCLW